MMWWIYMINCEEYSCFDCSHFRIDDRLYNTVVLYIERPRKFYCTVNGYTKLMSEDIARNTHDCIWFKRILDDLKI